MMDKQELEERIVRLVGFFEAAGQSTPESVSVFLWTVWVAREFPEWWKEWMGVSAYQVMLGENAEEAAEIEAGMRSEVQSFLIDKEESVWRTDSISSN